MTSQDTHARLVRIAHWGRVMVWIALLILAIAGLYYFWQLITDPAGSALSLADEHEVLDIPHEVSGWRLWMIALIWISTDVIGLMILLTALGLFALFAQSRVFVAETVSRLKRIGWLMVAIAPVSILSETINVLLFSMGNPTGSRRLSVSIDDSDVYALVIGLIIVAVGLAMSEALRLARENESFV